MYQQTLLNSQCNQSTIQPSTFRFRHPQNKKYILHKLITKQEKQTLLKLKRRTKKKDPEYFSNMLKEQKKKMFVNTFIKKLKNSITLHQPPQNYVSSTQQVSQQELESLQIPKNIEISISLFLFIQIIPLLILNSLSLIFSEVENGSFLTGYNIFSLIIHILQMGKKLLYKHHYQENKIKYLKENIKNYLYSEDFIIDLIVLLSFIIQIILNQQTQTISIILNLSHFGILLKIRTFITVLSHLELILIQNQYRQQIWNLIKVFLFNFVIAHCLTVILIAMTNFNQQKNWMIHKNLNQSDWNQKYVWGYYWSTTIMLTVGFGDIVPTNQSEALCMIFIQTMSCIVLAYNINRVGSIIAKIRSYDLQKNNNLKVFNHISQKNSIGTEIQDKITNYIKQSTVLKRNYNIQEEKQFISKLPISFKDQLLKEMNKKIWNGLTFFQNLSQKSLLQLSKKLQKKLTHPQQIVYTKGHQVDIMIFNNGTFGLAYCNGNARINGKIMEKVFVSSNQFRVASLDFLLQRSLNYDIKCIDYMIFYKVTLSSFLSTLQNHSYDYQYYFMIKDKDKFLLNEFEISKCKVCQNQRHTIFKCPRLHYIPLKQHVIGRHNKVIKKKKLDVLQFKILKREKISDIDSLKQRKHIKQQLIKIRIDMNASRSESFSSFSQLNIEDEEGSRMQWRSATVLSSESEVLPSHDQKTLIEMAVDKIKQNLQLNVKQNTKENQIAGVWELEMDLAHNYKFYFKNYNSEELGKKTPKRNRPKHSFSLN